jgi:uncharacterized RDD family membrane protein YckC
VNFGYSWVTSVVIVNGVVNDGRFISVIDVILALLGLFGLFGLVSRQSDIFSPVIMLLWLFLLSNLSYQSGNWFPAYFSILFSR